MNKIWVLALLALLVAALPRSTAGQGAPTAVLTKVLEEAQSAHPGLDFAVIVDGTFPDGPNKPEIPADESMNLDFANLSGLPSLTRTDGVTIYMDTILP